MLPPPGLTEQNSRMSEVCVEDRRVIWFGLDIVQLPVVWQFLALVQEKEFPELQNTYFPDEIILGFNVMQLGRACRCFKRNQIFVFQSFWLFLIQEGK